MQEEGSTISATNLSAIARDFGESSEILAICDAWKPDPVIIPAVS